jgi:hypothetical protein
MASAVATRPEPTEQQLQAAWLVCRRPGWPISFDETMRDPTRSRLVRLTALHPPPTEPRRVETPARTAWLPRKTTAPAFDCKRAAAGDRDDD